MAFMAACSELPRGAAVDKEILKTSGEAEADFAIYPVTRAFLPSIESWPRVGDEQYNWIGATAGYNSQVISPGDTLNIRIWDSGENSLQDQRGGPYARQCAVGHSKQSRSGCAVGAGAGVDGRGADEFGRSGGRRARARFLPDA